MLDIVLSVFLLIGIMIYIPIEQKEEPFELLDQKGKPIVLQETAVILFWSTTNKPSQRGLQVLTRLYKKHQNIQIAAVYSSTEDPADIANIQSSLGIQYPLFASSSFPSSLPLSLIVHQGKKNVVQEDLPYQRILSLLHLEL